MGSVGTVGMGRMGARSRAALTYVALVVAVTLLNIPTLLRGKPATGACGDLVPFLPGLDRFQNCDSPLFDRIAQDYSIIVGPEGMNRQARPGFMALGWLMDRVLQVLTLGRYDPLATGAPFYSSAEWGYLLLNAMVLAAAAGLVLLIITKSGRRSWGVTGLVLVLLVANPVTRAFFWTAHTQMFNLLVPPLAIYLASLALKSAWSWQRSVTIGVLLGLGLTTYGSFAVAIGTVLVTLLLTRPFRSLIIVGLASVGPALAWWAYVKSTTGGFFSPETTDFRQFIWVIDGLQQGNLISLAVKNTGWFLVSFADAQTFLALFLVTATLGIITAGVLLQPPAGLPPTSANPSLSRSIRAVGILLPLQIAFIWLMGFYQTRLSWGILTTLIVGLGVIGALAIERLAGSAWVLRINVIAIVVAAGWYATWLAIPGPWH